jgi:hypothetical protein
MQQAVLAQGENGTENQKGHIAVAP